ncbi:palmitoyltransferase ZDHHC15B-like isoform X2 [Brevipalpus obovatus]|uniref:palmitoyltransferase ZDHHC15B-like isoform X2 n=1 Tax=Brevipalpus obovatus TaxID=246614 RepID=UPI003D9EEBF6
MMPGQNGTKSHLQNRTSSSQSNISDSDNTHRNAYMGPRSGNQFVQKCQLCINIFKWVPVIFISAVLFWGYYAYVIQLCWFNMDSVILKVLCLIAFHFLYIMTFWSYYQVIFTQPGIIPKDFWFTLDDNDRIQSEITNRNQLIQQIANEKRLPLNCRDSIGTVRICTKCNIFKPDRTHHCSACNACVPKMDHHCPWVNNCVSFTNYKFFVLFLGYSFFLCLYTAASSFPYFLQFWNNQLTSESKFHVLFLFFVSIMFAISLVSLFGYHIYLLLYNRSTVESFRPPIFRLGPDRNAYNLGKYQNWMQIFGEKKLLWFVPVYTSLGNGIVFPSRYSARGCLAGESGHPLLEDYDEESSHGLARSDPNSPVMRATGLSDRNNSGYVSDSSQTDDIIFSSRNQLIVNS